MAADLKSYLLVWVLLGLNIVLYAFLVKYVRLTGYLEGRQSVYLEELSSPLESSCYAKGGCDDRHAKTSKSH